MNDGSDLLPNEGDTRTVSATVKWFNQDKGFGFVELDDSKEDAFLHISTLRECSVYSLKQGARVLCEVVPGERGPSVKKLLEIEEGACSTIEQKPLEGFIKFYNNKDGFGFVETDNGLGDIYISRRTLARSGIKFVKPGQRVKVLTGEGSKGLIAEKIEADE